MSLIRKSTELNIPTNVKMMITVKQVWVRAQ